MSYRDFIKTKFDALKCKHPGDPLVQIPVRNDQCELLAFMKPIIVEWRRIDRHLPEVLTRWCEENPIISTGTFQPTLARTSKWLDELVVGREDRLLFMLNAPDGSPLGHLGYSSFDFEAESGEIDKVLRGVKQGHRGLMTFASKRLIEWGYSELKLRDIKLSVYSDNARAIAFYSRMGFVEEARKPLHRVKLRDEEKWEIAPPDYGGPVEKYYLRMKYEGPGSNRAARRTRTTGDSLDHTL